MNNSFILESFQYNLQNQELYFQFAQFSVFVETFNNFFSIIFELFSYLLSSAEQVLIWVFILFLEVIWNKSIPPPRFALNNSFWNFWRLELC